MPAVGTPGAAIWGWQEAGDRLGGKFSPSRTQQPVPGLCVCVCVCVSLYVHVPVCVCGGEGSKGFKDQTVDFPC